MRVIHPFIYLIICTLFFSACSENAFEFIPEMEEKSYQRGQQLKREGRKDEALNAFLVVVEKRKSSPESHLEIGQLYAIHISDPIAAIYHYRKYLEYYPESKQAPLVEQLIDTEMKNFSRQLAGLPFVNDLNRFDLLDLLEAN